MDEKGILQEIELPCSDFDMLYDKIFIPKAIKTRLISQIILEFTVRNKVHVQEIPLHGIILLQGPPGTGKTSLAKGIASKAAAILKGKKISFIEAEPHSLTSSALGRSQKAVHSFLNDIISERANQGPLIVLLDEVETLAANRLKMSMEANPIDVHRATDALLAGLDLLSSKHKNLLFIATTNFEKAVDPAFLSRADLIEYIGNPNKEACFEILKDTIIILSNHWPKVKNIIHEKDFKRLADSLYGFDGRSIRKLVLYACTFEKEVALDINKLKLKHIKQAIKLAKEKKI
ncbi:MAG TPA: AAA family ATPase [Ignavibacteria bacterium]|jgi:SpoVK/Ycf46/Vps4 family AAA+-type ATPase